jgi:hypothetical protein
MRMNMASPSGVKGMDWPAGMNWASPGIIELRGIWSIAPMRKAIRLKTAIISQLLNPSDLNCPLMAITRNNAPNANRARIAYPTTDDGGIKYASSSQLSRLIAKAKDAAYMG